MAILTETLNAGEFIVSEANGTRSREKVVIAAAAAALPVGQVLGKITKAGTAVATALAGNAGNGVFGTITVGAGAKPGAYRLFVTAAVAAAGVFQLEDPDGVLVEIGNVAAAFNSGGIAFTLADGAVDFAVGDGFTITVAAGSGKYVAYSDVATDGSEVAAAILYADVPDSAADQNATAIVRHAEVDESLLTGLDTAGKADLAALGIVFR